MRLKPRCGAAVPRQKAPSAKRCIKTYDAWLNDAWLTFLRQKAPSAKRCIKTTQTLQPRVNLQPGQKAPSALRCIKTPKTSRDVRQTHTRQIASSAIRCIKTCHRIRVAPLGCSVRKHRAPKGTLGPRARPLKRHCEDGS